MSMFNGVHKGDNQRIAWVQRLVANLIVSSAIGATVIACGNANESARGFAADGGSQDTLGVGDASVGDATLTTVAADGASQDASVGATLVIGDATTAMSCTPVTCAELGYGCGKNGDKCGGILDCGACVSPEFCGGGGYSKCGTVSNAQEDGAASEASPSPCTPQTCAEQGYDCGYAGDGCGNSLDCGDPSSCPGKEYCGGGGPNKCGGDSTNQPDGAPAPKCVPTTCTALGYDCGYAGDGCGNQLDCGGTVPCPGAEYCGGAGPNKCGGSIFVSADGGAVNLCHPTTCAALGNNCGYTGDGCGNLLNCGDSCPGIEYCGGGGPNKCGGSVFVSPDGGTVNLCQPTTCKALGYNCGPASDGCGNLLQCGSCSGADTCGGGGSPSVCGHPCSALCQYQATCPNGPSTTITGRVVAGQSAWTGLSPDPVPNVLVYVPNGAVAKMAQGYSVNSCPQCGADVTGNPLVSTYTEYDGTFTLSNVPSPPAGQTLPLVIQLGRWRRQLAISPPAACAMNAIGDLNLPRNHTEGDIPLTAISTGAVDALECVLMKMGVDQAEFTSSMAVPSGRVHVYAAGPGTALPTNPPSGPGAYIANPNSNANPPAAISTPESALMATGGSYMNYDQIMLPCWGAPVDFKPADTNNMRSLDEPGNLITYANSGGHFFATHYSYTWLVNNGEFNNVAVWDPNYNNPQNVTWTLNVSKTPPVVPAPMHAGIFWQWLNLVQALSNFNLATPPQNPQVAITAPRHDADGVAGGSVDWIGGTDPQKNTPLVEHFTFNTPVGGASQCGHAIFSDFHVANETNTNSTPFPQECTKTFSAQEKILEYMIFDLASCVTPPASTCEPITCAEQGLSCGMAGDGCGNEIDCGTCTSPLTCGGGGIHGQCGAPDSGTCTPLTCAAQKLSCGPAGDGCGNEIQCGPCPPGQTCGGGGVPGQCGEAPTIQCQPQTCAAQHIGCGPAGDGCGNEIQCGPCPSGKTCGGGGVPGQCGGGSCEPLTCAALGFDCGPAGDGCGNLLDCGLCQSPATCGGGGVAGMCGQPGGPK